MSDGSGSLQTTPRGTDRLLPSNGSLLALTQYECFQSESESYITTDGHSASLSWNKASIWGLRPDFCYCQTVAGVLMWGALSDERTGLPFTTAAGPRQRSHFRVRVPWDSWPYFTVSDSRKNRILSECVIWLLTPLHGPSRKHRFQQYLYCYISIRCRGERVYRVVA
jgi:hypothetical protein